MRILARSLAVVAALALAAAAPVPMPDESLARAPGSARLDMLFGRLKAAKDPAEAGAVESMIGTIWAASSSDTANLLYSRGMAALRAHDQQLALDLFSEATTIEPDFAEAWHELGVVNFALNAHDEALVDLEQAVKLEPRHFAALVGLASIFELYGNERAALRALKRAYAVNPHIQGLEARINALSHTVEGQGI